MSSCGCGEGCDLGVLFRAGVLDVAVVWRCHLADAKGDLDFGVSSRTVVVFVVVVVGARRTVAEIHRTLILWSERPVDRRCQSSSLCISATPPCDWKVAVVGVF